MPNNDGDDGAGLPANQKFHILEWSSMQSGLNEVLVLEVDWQWQKLCQLDKMNTDGSVWNAS